MMMSRVIHNEWHAGVFEDVHRRAVDLFQNGRREYVAR